MLVSFGATTRGKPFTVIKSESLFSQAFESIYK